MLVIKVTKSEFDEIMRFENDGGNPVEVNYEIIEEKTEDEEETKKD